MYRRLPAGEEPALVHAAVSPGASILDLGCGAGRLANVLVRLGHEVTGVDESAEMLSFLDGPTAVRATIAGLDLGRRFDAVLLASHFVNEPDAAARTALLATCSRHVGSEGRVLVQAYDPAFDWEAGVGRTTLLGDVGVTLVAARRRGSLVEATVEYAVEGRRWRQSFAAAILDEHALGTSLGRGGLAFAGWLDRERGWLAAEPVVEVIPWSG